MWIGKVRSLRVAMLCMAVALVGGCRGSAVGSLSGVVERGSGLTTVLGRAISPAGGSPVTPMGKPPIPPSVERIGQR